jgi:hypothetical protein
MVKENVSPCPCCGYLVFSGSPGSDEICPICFWQDDISQLRFVRSAGANRVSLSEGQQNYAAYNASEERVKQYVRPPRVSELRESGWRPVNHAIDNIEDPIQSIDYGGTYPEDTSILYYWRPSYWRRVKQT